MPARQTGKSKMPQTRSADSNPRSESLSSSQDIVGRLRTATGLDLDLKREAADEIERLRMTPDELHCLQQILRVNHVKCIDPLREFVQRQVSPQENLTCKPTKADVNRLLDCIDSSQRTLIFEQEAEIARLKSRLRFCDAVIRSGDVAALTDAEREAVLDAALAYESDPDEWECAKIAAALRGLLERLGGQR